MCNIVHTCIKKYTVAVLYSCKFCTARVFLFLADHEAIQFTNILKIRRYLCADEAKGLLVPYVLVAVRRVAAESVNLRLSRMLYSADSGVLSSLLVEGT